ncbi:MAG: hypothetical protein JW791_03630 [Nanoarchaeota archaeon]|nr:hypothetical protein [Nanoarchaeota archaeon]
MSKAQSFGFDVLLTITAVLVFSQVLLFTSLKSNPSLMFENKLENSQLIYLLLTYNNSIALFDSYVCTNNIESFSLFNQTILSFLNAYVNNREYLLSANGLIYSSEGTSSVCLKEATPVILNINSSCNTLLSFEFSLYTQEEKTLC